jgi:DMSO/TMAO reductase YedYZ molybdopterin-dependent catalytic subunit
MEIDPRDPRDLRLDPKAEIARRTRRAFIVMGGGAAAGLGGWIALNRGDAEGIPPALRGILGFNEKVVRGVLYSNSHLVRTYPPSALGKIKVNAHIGLDDDIEDADWRLRVTPYGASSPNAELTIADIRALPRHEEIIDFKCVEGWSTVTQFTGARLSDFTAKFAPGSEKAACVAMKTPDEEYYVGLDMPSALHPQTLLAYEMNGAALEPGHGAPLRLAIPVKYGIKNIKRIGSIEYTDARPTDYWAERGYDWYAGL